MISLNKIGGQTDTASASFNVSKTADIANLPTDYVPNCSTCIGLLVIYIILMAMIAHGRNKCKGV